MAELEKQGLEQQTVNQEQDVVQETAEEVINEADVIKDDNDPVEVLKAYAMQLGLSLDDVQIMTKKELQSFVDRQVTQALKTREEKLRKEEERKRLETEGKYQELLRLERKEALDEYKSVLVKSSGLPDFITEMVDTSAFVDLQFAEAKARLEERIRTLAEQFNQYIESLVQSRLKEMQKGTAIPSGSSAKVNTQVPKTLEEQLKQFFSR
jgi:antitoxin component HigA of HigAB toxin-antitoxin module